jgi:hypothetical protein
MITFDTWLNLWETELCAEIFEENIYNEEEYIEQRFIASVCEVDTQLDYSDLHVPLAEDR